MCAEAWGAWAEREPSEFTLCSDAYLEHSRIFYFENDGDPDVFHRFGGHDAPQTSTGELKTLVKLVQTDHIKDLKRTYLDLAMSEKVCKPGCSGLTALEPPRCRCRWGGPS